MQKYRTLVGIAILAIITLFSTILNVIAQAEETGWPIVQQCMSDLSYPIVPQSVWDFEGVIFSSNSEGIRAIRSDFETSYFIALDGDTSFAFNGTFSPDGKWFAYPLGTSSYNGVWGYVITADAIQIVSTDPSQSIKYKWNMRSWAKGDTDYGSGKRYIKPIYWVDNQFIIF